VRLELRLRLLTAALLVALCSALLGPAGAADKADRVFVNGRVWTGDDARPWAEALAVRGPLLLAVGTTAQVKALAEKKTDVVDLKGRFVAPGFNDAHLHFMDGSLSLESVDLTEAENVEQIQRRLADYVKAQSERPWITGRGWPYSAFPGGLPHKKWLDTVVSDRPVWLTSYDEHTGWCNSLALVAAGINRFTKDPVGGVIVRDEAGEPSGALKEAAMDLVLRAIPPLDAETKYRALRKGLERAASFGLTSAQDAGLEESDLPVYERAVRERRMTLRLYAAVPMKKDPTPEDVAHVRELRGAQRSPYLRLGAVKGFVDGVVESKTAAMLEPYVGGGNGEPNWTADELNRSVTAYDRADVQVFLHAIGDRGIRMALDAYEAAARANGPRSRRHRVEHIENAHPSDIPRFKLLGVIASTQALFATPDKNALEVYAPLLGPERAARAMAFKAIDDAGAVQAFGSDWPVYTNEVLRGLYCAVARMTPAGTPAGGWQPQSRISAEAALRHFTRDAAFASFEEANKGTLTPGKAADFVVLSDDILQPPAERLLKARVLLTVMAGNDTYRAKEF
jgi:predicted amidohydrolase YtcJ